MTQDVRIYLNLVNMEDKVKYTCLNLGRMEDEEKYI